MNKLTRFLIGFLTIPLFILLIFLVIQYNWETYSLGVVLLIICTLFGIEAMNCENEDKK